MDLCWLFVFTLFHFSSSEWLLLPSLSTTVKSKNVDFCETPKSENCSHWHNLTTAYFFKKKNPGKNASTAWKLPLKDVTELYENYKSIPEAGEKKINFLREIEEKLQAEAETRMDKLFSPKARKPRTPYLYHPSMESSLMTVSMLLFGVYLTKIILRLLESHYTRYNNIGMINGIRGPIRIIKGRKKRSVDEDLKKFQLIYLVEKFNALFN